MAISVVMCISFIWTAHGQDFDREQLMDLFFKANSAKQSNDVETAIASYEKIIELSPSTAEPYLQLGDLYSTKAGDSAAIEKAIQCYKRYLELEPEAENAEEIRNKISALPIPVEIPAVQETVMIEPAADVQTRIDTTLYNRWASSAMAGNNHELWIIDIVEGKRFTFNVGLNENSHIISTDGRFAEMAENDVAGSSKADSVFFRFTMNIGSLPVSENQKEASIVYAYDFRMKLDSCRMTGNLHRQLIEKGDNDLILKDEAMPFVFHRVPSDYNGFTYKPVSAEILSSRQEFIDLFNDKVKESEANALAMNDLGCLYSWGIGTEKNDMIALAHFRNAADKGNLFAKLNLADMYRKGKGTKPDFKKAIDLYNQAFKSGFADAMVLCGDTYLDSIPDTKLKYEHALACYQKAAFQRSPYAFHRLAGLYKDGLGIDRDLSKAWEYYQKALNMQHPDATTDVGIFYLEGFMVEQNSEKALLLLMKAAAKDHPRAMYKLSEMYLEGLGVQQDFMTSKKWLEKAMKAEEMHTEGYNTIKSNINAILREYN